VALAMRPHWGKTRQEEHMSARYSCPYCDHTSVGSAAAEKHIEDCHPEKISHTGNGGRVMYLGHKEIPEEEQVWEINVRPWRSPES
jgi:hypothetical protein